MNAFSIRRILVALDASPSCVDGLKTAVALAARFGAELEGLFVEDIDVLRAVEFPFTRECGSLGTGARPLELRHLEGQLRAQAQRMRVILENAAAERRLSCTFRIVRGSVARELVSAGKDADLIILGRSGRSLLGPRRLGSTVREVITRRRGWTLILHQKTAKPDHPMALYDGTASARKALEAAAAFMTDESGRLRVFLLADTKEQAQQYRKEVGEILAPSGILPRFRLLISSSPSVVAHFVNLESRGPLFLPSERWQAKVDELLDLVKAVEGPVVVLK